MKINTFLPTLLLRERKYWFRPLCWRSAVIKIISHNSHWLPVRLVFVSLVASFPRLTPTDWGSSEFPHFVTNIYCVLSRLAWIRISIAIWRRAFDWGIRFHTSVSAFQVIFSFLTHGRAYSFINPARRGLSAEFNHLGIHTFLIRKYSDIGRLNEGQTSTQWPLAIPKRRYPCNVNWLDWNNRATAVKARGKEFPRQEIRIRWDYEFLIRR